MSLDKKLQKVIEKRDQVLRDVNENPPKPKPEPKPKDDKKS
jgi:hypothetical protein